MGKEIQNMFCFQCEQTAGCDGCSGKVGVCGKTAEVANLQDELTGALIGLARSLNGAGKVEQRTSDLVIRSLFATLTNVNFNEASIKEMIAAVQQEKDSLKPGCRSCANPCGMTVDLQLDSIWKAEENIRSLKSLVLFGLRGMAAYAYHAMVLGFRNEEVNYFFMKALFLLGEELTVEDLLPLVDEVGEKNLLCLELLDRANTESYGNPEPTEVPLKIEKGPFIVISGHDLLDLKLLLEQTDGKGVNIYTHGEMVHIGEDKDFTPVIEKALALGGYKEDKQLYGINGGEKVMTGFGHHAVLSHAAEVVEAVKAGKIRHFFLVGGCDGAKPGRNYYTEFVKQTPQDTIVLTLACGKFRFNDLDLGTIAGLPRIMDVGQCNDAYGAIRIALALAEAFGCSVNELPLSMVLSWYEQKAVCILLTLLHLGIHDILLGPTLPAFLSGDVLDILVKNYNIGKISTPEEDLAKLLHA